MKYGYFDNNAKEYIITNPKTPVKWINYIGGLSFGGFVDHTGGALICKEDPALNRILKYLPQLPASDFKGETLYVRIKEGSKYRIFSPYYVPTLDEYDLYECHVGLGYSKIISLFYGIKIEVTIFVPLEDKRVIREIKVTNLRKDAVELDLIPVVEYTHFDALKQFTNADWVPQTVQSKIINDGMYKILTNYAFMNKETNVNYFTSNYPVSSYESDRKYFLGNNEYGSWKNPLALENEELSSYEANRGDNIGALMQHLGKFKSGETKKIITQLGQFEKLELEKSLIEKYRDENNVTLEFNRLKEFWDNYLSKLQVETPDESMNTMLNIYNPRQCYITKNWSRYLSLYQLGFGARGIGFRDSAQDVMGVLASVPEEGRELIEMLLRVQKPDGSVMHQFNPKTMIATEGDSQEREDRPHYYGDDHLWIVMAVCSYLKETGNISFLQKVIPFYEGKEGTVIEHLKRAIEFTQNDRGSHGLPLLGFADWNDCVNLPKGSESFMIAEMYGRALLDMIELLNYLGEKEDADTYKRYYEEMKRNVNKFGWDGEWYIRYFDHEGKPVGSSLNEEGKLYVNSQSWSVISGFADKDRGRKALDSVNRILNTRNGIKLSYPGYHGYDPEKGGITTYPPGAKENGGIFLHCNPWVMIAESMSGNGDAAFQYYNQINPVCKNDIIEEFECEPYCYPQNILGDEHPQFGLGRNSWLSGTSSWVYQAATQFILGVKADYFGLRLEPCIPKKWKSFKVKRVFRNSVYNIEFKNPSEVNCGVREIIVDGNKIEGNIVPIYGEGTEHDVKVIMA